MEVNVWKTIYLSQLIRSDGLKKKKLFREFAEFETHASYLTPFVRADRNYIVEYTMPLHAPGISINNLQLCITNIPRYTPCLLSRIRD